MADDITLSVDKIKKEPEENAGNDLESDYHCSGEENSMKDDQTNKDGTETAKSDDDLQGYDTRSEVASSVSSSSDSDSGDATSTKSFDVKRKRHTKASPFASSNHRLFSSAAAQNSSSHRKNGGISSSPPLKSNSPEYIGKLNYLFRDARFFIIKSSNAENIALAKTKGVWATLPQNQIKLSEAFRTSQNVILVFSAKESGKFCGFARLSSGVDRSISPVRWVVPVELTANLLKGTFRIDWICRKDLPFSFATSLYNPWNNNKPVKIARDGQEVEPRVGEKLCRLFAEDESVDMASILRKSKEAAKNRRHVTKSFSPDLADLNAAAALYTSKYRMKMLHPRYKNFNDRKGFTHQQQHGGRHLHDVTRGRVSKHHQHRHHHFNPFKRIAGGALMAGQKAFLSPNKDGSGAMRGRVVASIETYVKRFGHAFRPPMMPPLSSHPFLPPHAPHPANAPHGPDMFPSGQFSHSPHLPPPPPPFAQPHHPAGVPIPLPRYYEPVPPPFAHHHFSKMNPMNAAAAAAAAASKSMYDRSVDDFLWKTRDKEYYADGKKDSHRSKRKDSSENSKGRRTHYRERR